MKKSLYEKALDTNLHSRFIARAEDLNRDLTDNEVRQEAQYQLETVDFAGFEKDELKIIKRQLRALLK